MSKCGKCGSTSSGRCKACRPRRAFVEPPQPCPEDAVVYDYVIVGAGTAGSVIAKLLTDQGLFSVLVIEGGLNRQYESAVQTPFPQVGTDPVERYHYYYPTILTAQRNTEIEKAIPFYPYQEGKMWGGSSGHNYMLAVRGRDAYDVWGAIDARWSYDALLPAMKYLEQYTAAPGQSNDPAERGQSGPLKITESLPGVPVGTDPTNPFFVAYAAATGSPFSEDYNNPELGKLVVGNGEFYRTPSPTASIRSFAANAFLDASVVDTLDNGDGLGVNGRPLYISSGSQATRLVFDDETDFTDVGAGAHASSGCCSHARVRGVRFFKGTEQYEVHARKKVILSSGTTRDAILLQLSGIGPADLLTSLGIPVRVANENVGRGAQNHFGPVAIIPADTGNPPPQYTTGFFDFHGPHAPPPTGLRQFQSINILTAPGVITMILADIHPPHEVVIEAQSNIAPSHDIQVNQNIFADPGDLPKQIALLKMIGDLSIAYTGALPIAPPAPLYPASQYAAFGGTAPDDSELVGYLLGFGPSGAQAQVAPFNHNTGSCKMATSDATGVVDGNLDVFGVDGLSVASNAVLPQILDGNTAWSAYLVGLQKAKIEGARVPY